MRNVCGLTVRAERLVALCSLGAALSIAFQGIAPSSAEAQVVISAGVQEIYDDNVFLENDNGTPPPVVLDDSLSDPELVIDPPEQVNGDPDEDYITNVFLGFSGPVPISPHVKAAIEGKVGALIFAEQNDESRMTVDAVFNLSSEKTLIPDPYYVDSKVALQSRSSDITAADGTATKQAQTLLASLGFGLRSLEIAPETKLGVGYTFAYNDFLGEFTFKDREDDLGPFDNRVEPQGSDYITNSLDSTLERDLTAQWKAGLYAGVTDYVFTDVETNDLDDKAEEDVDRTEGNFGVRSTYQVTEKLSAGASVGMNLSHLKTKPDDVFIVVVGDDGSQTQVLTERDQNDVSLTFGGNLNYAPDPASLIRLAVDQARRTDLDGDRLITRSATLDASKGFGDRFKLAAGGRFLQYNIGDSISNPTERWELTASMQYSLTESLALVAGYNYVNQDADEQNLEQRLLFASEDYEGSRVFIGLTGGLVGTKS